MYKKIFLLATFIGLSICIYSQNNTNSPYTRFGYGDLSNNTNGEYRAMGGTSIAMRSNRSINAVNPASYSSVDSLTFMFDVGISGLLTHFSDANGIRNTFNGNLEYVTLQFPITGWLGCSAGVLPYSSVGYEFAKRFTKSN